MKAISYPARNEVVFASLPDPVVGAGEVIIQVKASGICHTDFEVLKANYGTSTFPIVPGHEYAGIVAELGPGVTEVAIGDRVVVDPNIECGTCRACRRGWVHLCETLGANGVTRNGGLAELSVVKATSLHPIGDLTFTTAALAEPMGCALNGVGAVHEPWMETALIFGAGPMGLLMGIALKNHGILDIAFADIDDTRLELAESFGFGAVASGSADLEKLHQGVDLAVDATGVSAVAGRPAHFIANGGKGLFFGVCPSDARIEISPFEVFRRQLTLAGSHSLNHNIPKALDMIATFGPGIERIVSHQMSLEQVSKVLSDGAPKRSLKIQAVTS